jgi:hypothetical protein
MKRALSAHLLALPVEEEKACKEHYATDETAKANSNRQELGTTFSIGS